MITGASSGIGAATARAAVLAGLDVALMGRDEERLDALVAELGPEHALALPGDATDFDQQARAVEAAIARFGGARRRVRQRRDRDLEAWHGARRSGGMAARQ
ncbi:MAG: SDR family NAD(P)-dependent oxidoreductase [Lysobacteraceae bacterium]